MTSSAHRRIWKTRELRSTVDAFKKIDSIVAGMLDGGNLAEGVRGQEVLNEWSEIVGEQIAQHSRAVSLADGVLWVEVDGSVWAQELVFLTPHIQETIDQKLGSGRVREVRFRSSRV